MLFTGTEEFFDHVASISPLTKEETKRLGAQLAAGDASAREALIRGHLPFVASFIRRDPKDLQTLHTVYACISTLETAVDRFDFTRENGRFVDDLGRRLRQCIVRCIAER